MLCTGRAVFFTIRIKGSCSLLIFGLRVSDSGKLGHRTAEEPGPRASTAEHFIDALVRVFILVIITVPVPALIDALSLLILRLII
jgi:hypothetical protein